MLAPDGVKICLPSEAFASLIRSKELAAIVLQMTELHPDHLKSEAVRATLEVQLKGWGINLDKQGSDQLMTMLEENSFAAHLRRRMAARDPDSDAQ